MRHIRKGFACTVIWLLFSSCSTYEVRNVYSTVGEKSGAIDRRTGDVEIRVGINPDRQFYSVGVLGVPLVPTVVKGSDPKQIALSIRLKLGVEHEFSFLTMPCFKEDNSNVLCPEQVEASALGMFQDDGSKYPDKQKRWHKVPAFDRINDRIVVLTGKDTSRVTKEQIYGHYGYVGTPTWNHLLVDVTYRYKCAIVCPDSLNLQTADLVAIDGASALVGMQRFTKRQETDYRPTAIVQ